MKIHCVAGQSNLTPAGQLTLRSIDRTRLGPPLLDATTGGPDPVIQATPASRAALARDSTASSQASPPTLPARALVAQSTRSTSAGHGANVRLDDSLRHLRSTLALHLHRPATSPTTSSSPHLWSTLVCMYDTLAGRRTDLHCLTTGINRRAHLPLKEHIHFTTIPSSHHNTLYIVLQ